MTVDSVRDAFVKQIAWSEQLRAPFMRALLTALLDAGESVATLVGFWPGDPVRDAVPLRLAGALHALVLSGAAPDLAAAYPPHPTPPDLARRVAEAASAHEGFIRAFLRSPPQTNEVGRAASLLGGFLAIAAATGRPLHTLEIGASAGLNTLWDRFHYRLGGGRTWGDPASPVGIEATWTGPHPPLDAPVQVISRAACDAAPIDLADEGQRLRLRAYVWPDQAERLSRLDAAIALARAARVRVEAVRADMWLAARLPERPAGVTSVIYHSVMWQYVPAEERAAITSLVSRAGEDATATSPVAWLRLEPVVVGLRHELAVTLWPGGITTVLGEAHAHGAWATWRIPALPWPP